MSRYDRVKSVFLAAADLDAAERAAFLRGECEDSGMRREVEAMLAADIDTGGELERGIFHDLAATAKKVPEKIGEFAVVREIGRGGMGVVYEGFRERHGFRQRVALKVIKRGMDTDAIVGRFRVEQKILASLEHPAIARFLDGGMTDDGLPFYAMEFVEGVTIDAYCAANSLSAGAVVGLFREVCAAVQYAHQSLVVHRDLKPKNILVTPDGRPKLLDFGIGKVLTPDEGEDAGTATQLGMMTPAYASPEQIRGERIATTSDVYSLGVVLYELLTGRLPYDLDADRRTRRDIENAVLDSEPLRPSIAARRSVRTNPKSEIPNPKSLHGDLDNILLKALRKEAPERYVSVGQFSEDLRRYLEGLPVIARPHTLAYRATKFVRRNRVGVAAAGLVFLTLVGGIAATGWQAYRAEQQRRLAEKRFAEVRNIANNVVFKYHDEIEKLPGSTAVREMLVKDATQYLDNLAAESQNDPTLEHELARAYLKLGDVQGKIYAANIGNTAGAVESYNKSIALLEKVAAARPQDVGAKDDLVKANDAIVFLMARSGGTAAEKLAILDRSARLLDEILQLEPPSAARLQQLATLYVRYGDSVGSVNSRETLVEKLRYHEKALQYAEESLRLAPQDAESLRAVMRANQRLGSDHVWLGENSEQNGQASDALESYRTALPFHRKMFETLESLAVLRPDDASLVRNRIAAHLSYAETLSLNDRGDDAVRLAEKGLGLAIEIQSGDRANREARFDVAEAYSVLARIVAKTGAAAPRREYLQKARDLYAEVAAADPTNKEAAARKSEMERLLKE